MACVENVKVTVKLKGPCDREIRALQVSMLAASAFLRIYPKVGLVACHRLMEVMTHAI